MKALIAALVLLSAPAMAKDIPTKCKPYDGPKGARTTLMKEGDRWTKMTPSQFQFMRGIYVGSPSTPEGLPLGDGAALITKDGAKGGLVAFTDHKNVCDMLPLPQQVIDLLMKVGAGETVSEGDDAPSL